MAGELAHLVERIHGMDEVAGSSPAWSTFRAHKLSKKYENLIYFY